MPIEVRLKRKIQIEAQGSFSLALPVCIAEEFLNESDHVMFVIRDGIVSLEPATDEGLMHHGS